MISFSSSWLYTWLLFNCSLSSSSHQAHRLALCESVMVNLVFLAARTHSCSPSSVHRTLLPHCHTAPPTAKPLWPQRVHPCIKSGSTYQGEGGTAHTRVRAEHRRITSTGLQAPHMSSSIFYALSHLWKYFQSGLPFFNFFLLILIDLKNFLTQFLLIWI